MKKQQAPPEVTLPVSRAVGNLLRLANAGLKDASLLSSGRDPGNAPSLANRAFHCLVLAIIATERGWPLPCTDGELSRIPDANPLKAAVVDVAKMRANFQLQPALLQDGSAPPAPDREGIRKYLATVSALLKNLAMRFEVDLLGGDPAGRASPVRPEPSPQPTEAPPSHPGKARPAPAVTARPADPTPPQTPEPHEVEGRSPIERRPSSNTAASTAFWALMDHWQVGELEALDLIAHPGGLTKKGTRPRFKLTGEEGAMLKGLQEIDSALALLQLDPKGWLDQPMKHAPFSGTTPIAYLIRTQQKGVRETIKFILQHGLKLSMAAGTTAMGFNSAAT